METQAISCEIGTDDYDSDPGAPWFLGINSWESTGVQIQTHNRLQKHSKHHHFTKGLSNFGRRFFS